MWREQRMSGKVIVDRRGVRPEPLNGSLGEDDADEDVESSAEQSSLFPRPVSDDFDNEEDYLLLPSTLEREQQLRVVLRLTSFGEDEVDHICYYYIQVCAETMLSRIWCIRKRYSQFHALRKELKRIVKNPPQLPGKDVVKRFLGVQDLRQRANGLSTFLWRIAADPILCNSQPVRRFLGTDVIENPPANVHSTTPLISSSSFRGLRSDSAAISGAASFLLDGSVLAGSIGNKRSGEMLFSPSLSREGEGTTTLDDTVSDDGRLFLGRHNTADALQKGFAEEGLAFSEADIHEPMSEDISLDEEDSSRQLNSSFRRRRTSSSSQQGPRVSVPSSEPICSFSFFGFGTKKRKEKNSQTNLTTDASPTAEEQLRLLQHQQFPPAVMDDEHSQDDAATSTSIPLSELPLPVDPFPSLRVVILLVGSRGDVQPYVALGKALKQKGHLVRIAAHECFREWIEIKHGLQFAPIAGDPKELLKMVVENKMFSYNFVKNGVTVHRSWVAQVLVDCWHACTLEDPNSAELRNQSMMNGHRPPYLERRNSDLVGPGHAFNAMGSKFRADLIIANPPSFAGWHCAEALGVPLLMSFPMPWSRTTEFPSPFTSLSALTSPASLNWMSYGAVDRLIWLGLGDLINAFRVQTLWLHPIWTMSAKGHRYIHDYRVPFLYCWSPSVLAKPQDWGSHILVSGYLFLDDSDGKDWQPNEVLLKCFGNSSRRVVFIGFGSIVVKDPENLSMLVLSAAKVLIDRGYNVLVQKGWAGVDFPEEEVRRDGLFLVGAAPHSWIFPRCAAVVHHGGSGTTAEGLRVGIPTVIVPFFGDQFFWGETVKRRGLGDSEPYVSLTTSRLVECVTTALDPEVKMRCLEVSDGIKREDGAKTSIDFIERVVFGFDGFDAIVAGTSTSHHPQQGDWRRYPYYDLKKRVKLERYQNVKGLRKIKSRINKIASTISSSSATLLYSTSEHHGTEEEGVEMKPMRAVSSSSTLPSATGATSDVAMQRSYSAPAATSATAKKTGAVASINTVELSFPFLPEMYPGRVPQGHTPYSWFGKRLDERGEQFLPAGHTKYSWTAATW